MENINKSGISKILFGQIENKDVFLYKLANKAGNYVTITDYGGIVTEWVGADKNGKKSSIIIGFKTLDKYIPNGPHFGALIGRYANRIAKGKFTLNGKSYTLACNNGNNHLHGGYKGFDKYVWDASIENEHIPQLALSYTSHDGEEGYPGNLKVNVTYRFTDLNELEILYSAVTDQPTPINLTSHGYFNLTGNVSNDILGHSLIINAEKYTPVNTEGIPTGAILRVENTPYDFTNRKKAGLHISETTGGYDHNYVVDNHEQDEPVAIVWEETSGRKLEVFTDQPGVQFYTGNSLDGTMHTDDGEPISRQSALCLETQHFPDSPNKPQFPSTILNPGEEYHTYTKYRLSIE